MPQLNFFQKLWLALPALFSSIPSIRIGQFVLTATNNGLPVHFTFAMAFAALTQFALSGETTTSFQIGSELITVLVTKDLL